MAASSVGAFKTIRQPVLEKVPQPALVEFRNEYNAYRTRVEDINSLLPLNRCQTPASVNDCIEANVLKSLVLLHKFEGATTVDEVTPDGRRCCRLYPCVGRVGQVSGREAGP